MSNRGKVVLGNPEINKLKCGESIVVKLKPGMDELEIKLSILVARKENRTNLIETLEIMMQKSRIS